MDPLFIISFCLSLFALWFNWRCLKEITRREKEDQEAWERAVNSLREKSGIIKKVTYDD